MVEKGRRVSEHNQGTAKAWGGRFASTPDKRLEAFNASVAFDVRLALQDIRGSVAHVRMLGRQGIISGDDASTIEEGLWQVWDEVELGAFELTVADEDIHTGVERRLREIIGPVTGRLHTGRSRNDQVATDFRLWTKDALLRLIAGTLDMIDACLGVAQAYPDAVMPGYTHLQRAQPVLLAHHMHAYACMFERDVDRLRDALRRTDVMPLGSAAMAGTTYPIDRQSVAEDLGFAAITANSMDGVSDRDFVIDALAACSTLMMHISRLSEEVIFWSSGEAKYVTLSDAFSTGSSIMPQKKNADVAELARGKTGRVYGHLMGMLTVAKGLPLTYNKDFQEDKEGLFDAVDTCLMVLDVVPPMLTTATFNVDRMAGAATADFSLSTDVADLLARNGVPFREAHEVVGKLVGLCTRRGITFADLTEAEWAEAHALFSEKKPPMTALESVSARDVPGGTAPNRVRAAIEAILAQAQAERSWLEQEQARLGGVMTRSRRGPQGS
jgi:argininosuccinate lyase